MSTTTSTTPTPLDSKGFAKLWKSLYDPAVALSSQQIELEGVALAQHQRDVVKVLQSMASVIFGADESKKTIAICYQDGCLQLCMNLVISAQVGYKSESDGRAATTKTEQAENNEAVWTSALKVVKCSVIKCNVGRQKCRTAGVFDFIGALLQTYLTAPNKKMAALLVEECMTTLAAVCLGDDLNALQVCTCVQ